MFFGPTARSPPLLATYPDEPNPVLPAVQTRLGTVGGIAVDQQGRVWISDATNRLVWLVLRDGTISIAIRNGLQAPGRIAFGSLGDGYFIDGNRIRSVDGLVVAGNGETGRPQAGAVAIQSPLFKVDDLAVNSRGEVYFLDRLNRLIIRIGADGKLETVLDGGQPNDPNPPYLSVTDIDFDADGNLILVDNYARVIRKLSTDGVLSVVAGKGAAIVDGESAADAILYWPTDLEALPDGSIVFVDQYDHRIFRVAPGGMISTFAGNGECGSTGDGGPASRARLCWPSRITADKEGNTYFVDNGVRIRRVSPEGTISTISGGDERFHSGDGGPAADARFAGITDVVADSAGNLYIGEWGAFRIRRISPDGRIDSVAGTGELSNPATVPGPEGRAGATVAVAPSVTAIDADGSLLIYDIYLPRFQLDLLLPNGLMLPVYWSFQGVVGDDGIGLCYVGAFKALVFDEGGVIATDGTQVCRFDRRGAVSWIAGTRPGFGGDGGPATGASFAGITGLAVDREGNIYIADTGNRRIRKLTRIETGARP